jgi:hypothetical protein
MENNEEVKMSVKKGKDDKVPMSFVNNECKALRGVIVILYKVCSSSL